jgi:hypothetical protein
VGLPQVFNKTMPTASANNISLLQTRGTSPLLLNGSAVTAGVANIDTLSATNTELGVRVSITSGGNDTGIKWIVSGTNGSGNKIVDVFAGASGGAAQSNLDFVTVTSIVPSGAIASTATAGTNGVGSTRWFTTNWHVTAPFSIGMCVELVSGAANFTVQHTYDDPNSPNLQFYNLAVGQTLNPLAFNHPVINAVSATTEGAYTTPVAAINLIINSGTGQVRFRSIQGGIG